MKLFRVLTVAMLAMLVMMPAMANTAILDNKNPASEDDLWLIYETLGFGDVPGDDSNNIPQVSPDEIFSLLSSGQFVATVRYAGNTNTFGWYQPVGGGPVTLNPILVAGPGAGYINISALISPIAGNFGFYLDSTGYQNNTWYSESSRNLLGQDHMIGLSTGNPNVILLAWEDLPLFGTQPANSNYDSDYNDLVIQFTRVVPEPTSMMLLGMGIAGMVARKIRRKLVA